MRGIRITPKSIENIDIETHELQIEIITKTDGMLILKIRSKDPHKHSVNTETYSWEDKIEKQNDTENIYIIPKVIKN